MEEQGGSLYQPLVWNGELGSWKSMSQAVCPPPASIGCLQWWRTPSPYGSLTRNPAVCLSLPCRCSQPSRGDGHICPFPPTLLLYPFSSFSSSWFPPASCLDSPQLAAH